MKKSKQIQWGEAVNRNSTDLPHALHLATGSGNGFEGAFDKIPGGESGLGVNTGLELTHFAESHRSKIDPPWAPFWHQADAVFLAV